MKRPTDADEPIFNRPAEIGRRLAYLGYLAGVAVCPVAVIIGVGTDRPASLGVGLLAVALAGLCHLWLRTEGRLDATARDFETMFSEVRAVRGNRVAHLVQLLVEWEELEHRRGTPSFDPWSLQTIRRNIRLEVDGNQALSRLFDR